MFEHEDFAGSLFSDEAWHFCGVWWMLPTATFMSAPYVVQQYKTDASHFFTAI